MAGLSEKRASLGVPIGLILVVVSATLWLTSSLHAIDTRLLAIEQGISDRWTSKDMTIWSLELVGSNRGLALFVPDPRNVVNGKTQENKRP